MYRGKPLSEYAPWYQAILADDDKVRERIASHKADLACEDHTEAARGTQMIGNIGCKAPFGWARCACGAFKWDSERNWQDMGSEDREKLEEEIEELTEYLREKNGTFEI